MNIKNIIMLYTYTSLKFLEIQLQLFLPDTRRNKMVINSIVYHKFQEKYPDFRLKFYK